MVARNLTKKKKVKKVFSRRLKTGYDAGPVDNFWAFKDYVRTEADKKETAKIIKEYIKDKFNKKDAKVMLSVSEYNFVYPFYIAATIKWQNLGYDIPTQWNYQKLFAEYFAGLKKKGLARGTANDDDVPKIRTRTIQDIVKEKTSEFISDVESVLDDFYNGYWLDIENYSPFLELKKIDAAYNLAKGVYDYYIPLRDEIKLLVNKKPADLNEGYMHLPLKKRKEYLQLLEIIVSDVEKYMNTKKAIRKVKIAKPQAADKQVKKLSYLNESNEYKLVSINPTLIVGAARLYTFNAKTRMLTEFVCMRPKGFEIKGTTLVGIDLELSRETRLRKPEEFLNIVMSHTPTKISAAWNNLTTKTNTPNSRINKDMLLLKVFNK